MDEPVAQEATVTAEPVKARPFSFADFPEDEEKTAAFEVPEELLRRSRVAKEPVRSRVSEVPLSDRTVAFQLPAGFADNDEAPDSRANTSPPPAAEATATASPIPNVNLMPGGLGQVFQQAAASERLAPKLALVGDYSADLIDDDESGEFTRIGHDGDIEALTAGLKEAKVPNVIVSDEQTSLEATRTKVRPKQNVQVAKEPTGLLWSIIVVLLLATSVLAALVLKAI